MNFWGSSVEVALSRPTGGASIPTSSWNRALVLEPESTAGLLAASAAACAAAGGDAGVHVASYWPHVSLLYDVFAAYDQNVSSSIQTFVLGELRFTSRSFYQVEVKIDKELAGPLAKRSQQSVMLGGQTIRWHRHWQHCTCVSWRRRLRWS